MQNRTEQGEGVPDVALRDSGAQTVRQILARPLPPGADGRLARIADAAGAGAVYVSTPITTGPGYVRWLGENPLAGPAERAAARARIVRANIGAVVPLVAQVRRSRAVPVIDPTELEDVPGWEQADYHRFWSEVIVRHAVEVVLADGWSYSVGCTVEFAVALAHGIPLTDSHERAVTSERGCALLREAIPAIEAVGAPARMQRSVLADLVDPDRTMAVG